MSIANVSSAFESGNLVFRDVSGNEILTLDAANLAVVLGSGVSMDLGSGKLLFTTAANTATSDGLTTGTIADAGMIQFVTVTSASANNIIVLPTPTPGTIILLANGATGYELRSSNPASVSINGGSESAAESAIAASSLVIAVCTGATKWQAISIAGETLAAVEAAAAA